VGLSWRAVAGAAVGAAFILAAGGALTGCACGKIRQTVYVATPDPALQVLVDACRTNVPPPGTTCSPPIGQSSQSVSCACKPLCHRVLELIDQFSGGETLLECRLQFQTLADAGPGDGAGGTGTSPDAADAGDTDGGGGVDAGVVDGGTADAGDAGPGSTIADGGRDAVAIASRPDTVTVYVTYRRSTCE